MSDHWKDAKASVKASQLIDLPFNAIERNHIAALIRRLNFLNQRLRANQDKCLSYDRTERAAILWALKKITGRQDF